MVLIPFIYFESIPNVKPLISQSFSNDDVKQISEYLKIPPQYLRISIFNANSQILVLCCDEFGSLLSKPDIAIAIFQRTKSNLQLVGKIDKSMFDFGEDFHFDLAPYRLNKSELLIGLRYKQKWNKRPNQWLTLFRLTRGKLVSVLAIDMQGEYPIYNPKTFNLEQQALKRILIVSNNSTNGAYNILSKAALGDGKTVSHTLRWNGTRYVAPNGFLGSWAVALEEPMPLTPLE